MIQRAPSESGLTVLCSLSDDNGATPLAGSTDIGSFTETALKLSDGTTTWAITYGRDDVAIPDGFKGIAVFHTGAAGADFSGAVRLAHMPIDLFVTQADTIPLPGQEAPVALQTVQGILGYLYKAFRNKQTHNRTTGEHALFADDATTVDQKSTTSDDGTTFTRGEFATGP